MCLTPSSAGDIAHPVNGYGTANGPAWLSLQGPWSPFYWPARRAPPSRTRPPPSLSYISPVASRSPLPQERSYHRGTPPCDEFPNASKRATLTQNPPGDVASEPRARPGERRSANVPSTPGGRIDRIGRPSYGCLPTETRAHQASHRMAADLFDVVVRQTMYVELPSPLKRASSMTHPPGDATSKPSAKAAPPRRKSGDQSPHSKVFTFFVSAANRPR